MMHEISEFLTKDNFKIVENRIKAFGLRGMINYNHAPGVTISEKYEAIRGKIMELIRTMNKKGVSGYFWLVANPEICWALEGNMKFCKSQSYLPMGRDEIELLGTLDRRVLVYSNKDMAHNHLVIGCDVPEDIQDENNYSILFIGGYIV
jgi:uncharacterized linocin/CFP29 family protein